VRASTGDAVASPAIAPLLTHPESIDPAQRSSGTIARLVKQFTRYLIVGGAAFVVDFGSLYLLTEFAGFHYLKAAALAFVFGLVTNYCLCRLWVFDRRTVSSTAVEFTVFAVIGLLGLGLNEAILWFVTVKMHLHYLIAKCASASLVLVWNFGARKTILFR
jgi:putative flippase GtrA